MCRRLCVGDAMFEDILLQLSLLISDCSISRCVFKAFCALSICCVQLSLLICRLFIQSMQIQSFVLSVDLLFAVIAALRVAVYALAMR